ncbi:hypothetical protein ACE1CI_08070 [Aerosakkonemataceae cyanobacterium BLCC-F50]|uniref:Uncharacterized protein n=1 Tax=Floridaenema flaviceps BLCC-F50 TaxID=3153642 RepID=A0ABV4XME0_9CYAN
MSMRSQIQKKPVSSSYSPPAQKVTCWQRPFRDPVHDATVSAKQDDTITANAGFNLTQMKIFPDATAGVQTKQTGEEQEIQPAPALTSTATPNETIQRDLDPDPDLLNGIGEKASPKIRAGDWDITFQPNFKTDDRYDTPENRRRAEQKDEAERRGDKYPNPLEDRAPVDPKDPHNDPLYWKDWGKPKEPQQPVWPLKNPLQDPLLSPPLVPPESEQPSPGDYPVEPDDSKYA